MGAIRAANSVSKITKQQTTHTLQQLPSVKQSCMQCCSTTPPKQLADAYLQPTSQSVMQMNHEQSPGPFSINATQHGALQGSNNQHAHIMPQSATRMLLQVTYESSTGACSSDGTRMPKLSALAQDAASHQSYIHSPITLEFASP